MGGNKKVRKSYQHESAKNKNMKTFGRTKKCSMKGL